MYTDIEWFKDETGNTLLLCGVNLGGSSKVPYQPDCATWCKKGFTFLRFLITREAVEHEAPGVYDTEYLDYLEKVGLATVMHSTPEWTGCPCRNSCRAVISRP